MKWSTLKKQHKLILGLLFDLLGYVSFVFPPFDFLWAPLSGYLMTKLYEGKKGKIAGIFVFIEEALPFVDVVPTFTIMWLYTYWYASTKTSAE
ncbi:hypothetical protein N9R87_03410 [Flavobacteriaceae bacterium]|jgi:hypothetical protein|nr:hypothetical protein [Flavobacteriaceae bacterium]MDA9576164.1 hypothetical protein [Flavobacteriaceae bacterium]MDB2632035.1 hypothetical protein [Flavobacteriaceae bacterium]CAI8422549.1 MAG: Uncharacterised protein [Formosa sp. Hel3_A1_48]